MINSSTLPVVSRFHRRGIVSIVVLICWPVFASDTMPKDANDLQIAVTQKGISVGSTVLCSIAALESSLESESRTRSVVVNTDPDVDTEIHLRVLEVLKSLDFEQVSATGAGDPGWALYPFSLAVEFPDCEESSPKETIESGNDS